MEISEDSSNNKRIAKNTIFLYIRMIFLMFLGFYTSRETLKILGQEDYGIYNIVGGVIVLFQFLNASLTSAMQRYLNFSIGEKDEESSKKIFSISMRVYVILSLILFVLCETIGVGLLNFYLNIPEGRLFAANMVFQFSSITMIVNMFRIPFNSSIIATERMSFFAYVSILEGVLKLLIVYLLLVESLDKLILFSILTLIVSIIMLFVFYIYCKKNIFFITFKKYKDPELVKAMLSFSGWNVFGSFASIAVNQGINIFINRFYGVLVNAAIGAANQANVAITSFLTNFQTAFNPQLVKSYAQKQMDYVYSFSFRSSKYSFFLMYFIILPFTLNMDFVLSLWLSEVPVYTAHFIKVMLFMALIDAVADPFWMLAMAEGDIKFYQIFGSITMFLIIPIAYVLLRLGFPPYWALLVKSLQGVFFFFWRFFYLKKRINLPVRKFFVSVFSRILIIFLISYPLAAYFHKFSSRFGNIFQFLMSCVLSCILLAILYWFIGIDKIERKTFTKLFKEKILRK